MQTPSMPPDFTQELPGLQSVSNWQARAGDASAAIVARTMMVFMDNLLFLLSGSTIMVLGFLPSLKHCFGNGFALVKFCIVSFVRFGE